MKADASTIPHAGSIHVIWQSNCSKVRTSDWSDVAGAENDDMPITPIECLEVQLDDTTARHADVALEIPLDKYGRRQRARCDGATAGRVPRP